MAHTATMTDQDLQDSQYLSSSLSSLSRSRSTNSLIVRTYKEATQLYLTKRFKEALETLEPIISPRRASEASAINGLASENNAVDTSDGNSQLPGVAPIAQSSRGTRTKVWVFYLSLLHAIIELGAEEGRLQFGSGKWKELALKARDGKVWDEIVQHGYGGSEGDIDADVVVNLATLLIEHMHDQHLTQHRLETYLSVTEFPENGGASNDGVDGTSTSVSVHSSSPKALQTRLKILELYTLHVLPANEEWQYAWDFIDQCDALDLDRKEAFSNALQQLKEEKDGQMEKEMALVEQQQKELEQARQEEEEKQRVEAARLRQEEEERRQRTSQQPSTQSPKQPNFTSSNANGVAKASSMRPSSSSSHQTPSQNRRPSARRPIPSRAPQSILGRAAKVLGNLHKIMTSARQGMSITSTAALLRLVMFMLAFLVILVRRDLRIKLQRALEGTWAKVRQTVGMGVKVSYV